MADNLRILTYNILLGGRHREERIAAVLQRADPHVIALQEVIDIDVARRWGKTLGMEVIVGTPSEPSMAMHNVLLSRLPVSRQRNRHHPGMLRSHLECTVRWQGSDISVHNLHLAARFNERNQGETRRTGEIAAVLKDIDGGGGGDHIIAGDFNSLAPEDSLAASAFFDALKRIRAAGLMRRRVRMRWDITNDDGVRDTDLDPLWQAAQVDPLLVCGVPRLPWILYLATHRLPPRHPVTDRVLGNRLPRRTLQRLREAGFVDCYRALHATDPGYTCATWVPAARVDYVMASPSLAQQLRSCDVVGTTVLSDAGVRGASDHFPVMAEYAV